MVNAAQEIFCALLETDDDQPLSCITLHMKDSPNEPPGHIFKVDSHSDILDPDPVGSPDDFPGCIKLLSKPLIRRSSFSLPCKLLTFA